MLKQGGDTALYENQLLTLELKKKNERDIFCISLLIVA